MKLKNIRSHYHNKGFTLVELLIAISLTAIIASGLYIVANNASDSKKVNVEVNNVTSLIKKIESATVSSDFAGLSNSQLTTMGINFTSEFKNPVVQGIDPKSYSITYNNISARQCTDFASKTQLKINSLQKVVTKVNGQEFNSNNVTGIAEACKNNLNEVILIVSGNTNTTLAAISQDAPPPPHVTPGDLDINPVSPPNGVVPPVPHTDTNNPNIPEYGATTSVGPPTSTGPNGMGDVPNNGAPPPVTVVAPPMPPPPPPPPAPSGCGYNVRCCNDYRGVKTNTCVAATETVETTCPAGSPRSNWSKVVYWKIDWHYSPTEPKEIIVTSSWYKNGETDNSSHFCSIG